MAKSSFLQTLIHQCSLFRSQNPNPGVFLPVFIAVAFFSFELWGRRARHLKQNECNGDKQDRISGLPDAILSSILSRLSFRDAVKTGRLSRRWRYLFASMPNLDFNSLTMFGVPEEDDHICPLYLHKFVNGVNQFIQLYSGPKIVSFRFAFCFGSKFAADTERWIMFAIRLGVEELDIDFQCNDRIYYISFPFKYNELSIFSCQLLSQASKLKRLHLQACIVKPSFNVKINSLKSLDLDGVPLAGREVEDIMSCCLNLEELRMRKCSLPAKLSIHDHSLRLKFLTVNFCFGLEAIDLLAINLTMFECFNHELIKFSFSRVPKLERVFLHMIRDSGMPYIFNELPEYLPQLKTLLLRTGSDQLRYLPARITLFSNLRQLDLIFTTRVKVELLKLSRILSACPLLQKFYLVTTSWLCNNDIGTEVPPPCDHTQLEEVEFGGFKGTQNELSLALYLLRSATALKRMFISRNFRFYRGFGNWEHVCNEAWTNKERKLIHRQLQGKALSGSAEVIFM